MKDFASWIPPECRDLFGDAQGEDRVGLALVDTKAFDDANRRLRFVASDDSIDLQDEIIDAGAFHELRDVYLRNPVMLSGHQHRTTTGMSPAMAHVVELDTAKSPLVGVAQFGEGDHVNAVSPDLWRAYRGGNQRAFSVGFRSRDIEKRDGRWVHTKALLLEISGVPVGANSNALVLNYIYERLAQFGGTPGTDRRRGEDVAQILRELEERLRTMEESYTSEAGSSVQFGAARGEPNAEDDDEDEIAECFGRAVGVSPGT